MEYKNRPCLGESNILMQITLPALAIFSTPICINVHFLSISS